MYKFYAKSLPKPYGETIEEHTSKVKKNFESLKNFIDIDEKEESIIEKIIEFHDLGKINPLFQNKIRKRLNIKELFDYKNVKIYHEWLSPSFINEKEELIIKEKLKEMNLDADRFFNLFIFIILSHHYRENQMADDDLINEMICWIKNNFRYEVDYFYNVNHLLNLYNNTENREMWNLFFSYRVTWLGALLKSDYCASAGIEPEQKYNGSYSLDFDRFIYEKKIKLKDFQIKAKENKDKNIILVASTGIGKTEAAMNWINGQKAFYLLGIRIAVNEMYKRFRYIFGENVALLHGESSYFFAQQDEDNQQDEDDLKIKIEKCRKLCYPLTVATADQLVTAVFKYAGFELTYFTCKYSKIIIDEIQSYSPSSIAAIVVFLKEIHRLGGKFMLMTATLPTFLLDELKDISDLYIFEPQLLEIKRHKICMVDQSIESQAAFQIVEKFKNKKILIICNTVKKAQKLFDNFKDFKPNLIHSRFIMMDRQKKEKLIMEATAPCVWIATEIVEASLDIDFDILITENASIESLLQRTGRCYRGRIYDLKEPNIYIFKSEPYNIYDKYLFDRTWEVIQSYDNRLISENDKQDMIKEIFKNIQDTDYYKEYKNQKDLLEIGYRSFSKIEAQSDFRQITYNCLIIPENVFEDNKKSIEELIAEIEANDLNHKDLLKKQQELLNFTIPISILWNLSINDLVIISESKFCKQHFIRILKNCEYSFEKGLVYFEKKKQISLESSNII